MSKKSFTHLALYLLPWTMAALVGTEVQAAVPPRASYQRASLEVEFTVRAKGMSAKRQNGKRLAAMATPVSKRAATRPVLGLEFRSAQQGYAAGASVELLGRMWNDGDTALRVVVAMGIEFGGELSVWDPVELEIPAHSEIGPVPITTVAAPQELTQPAVLSLLGAMLDPETGAPRTQVDLAHATIYPKSLLPAPRGPFTISSARHHLQSQRPDAFAGRAGARRELMARVWFPAAANLEKAPLAYQTPETAKALWESNGALEALKDLEVRVQSHAYPASEVDPVRASYPLILFSPGLGEVAEGYAAMLEDLASKGFIVAAIDHPYVASGVTVFPGGRTEGLLPVMELFNRSGEVIETLAGDVTQALDWLAASPYASRIDWSRVAVTGHSLGGATAISAAAADGRVKTAVNIDGSLWGRVVEQGPTKPVLFLSMGSTTLFDPTHAAFRGKDSVRIGSLIGAGHLSMVDMNQVAYQLAPVQRLLLLPDVETVQPRSGIAAIVDYIEAYLDTQFSGKGREALLEAGRTQAGAVIETLQ